MYTMNNDDKRVNVAFLAIDQYIEDNIVKPTEIEVKGKDFISWGDQNNYPDYIEDLYVNVSTLKSIIDGTSDYIIGDDIICNVAGFDVKVNRQGHTIKDIIKWVAKDLVKFGGFALNIVRNRLGTIAEIYYLDFKKVRSNKDNTKLYYSGDWGRSFGRVKYNEYPSFFNENEQGYTYGSTIFYYKNDVNYTYPISMFSAVTKACEIEKKIDTFHLNNVNNNFAGSYIVNFNSGRPTDEIKEEIERQFYDKFTGVQNAGRPMLSFNNSKDNEVTITKIEEEGFADKYKALSERTRQQIFTSVRCTPNLFGIPNETTGFNQQEYFEAYNLFDRTVIKPRQNEIVSAFDKIFGIKNSIEIKPFILQKYE